MIGIIGAMDEEVELLRSSMTGTVEEPAGPFRFYRGTLEGREVVLLRCGIGKVNAAVGCALLIERYAPDFVVNTGSAGGIGEELSVGDVVIADGLAYNDVDVSVFGYAFGQLPRMPAVFVPDADLAERADRAVDELKAEGKLPEDLRRVHGLTCSGDSFMHDPARIAELRERFPLMRAVEMESTAVAHTCYLFSVPVLVIRAVSDVAGSASPVDFDEFLPVAARHSGEIVRRVIKEKD